MAQRLRKTTGILPLRTENLREELCRYFVMLTVGFDRMSGDRKAIHLIHESLFSLGGCQH
jgi:hypothetical protein